MDYGSHEHFAIWLEIFRKLFFLFLLHNMNYGMTPSELCPRPMCMNILLPWTEFQSDYVLDVLRDTCIFLEFYFKLIIT